MKTIIKTLFVFLTLAMTMVSCREDYKMPDTGAAINPEKEIAGTYVGVWIRDNVTSGDSEQYPGTLVIGASTAYVITITTTCDDLDLQLESLSTVANVTWNTANEYNFYNLLSTNPFGTTFSGKVINKEATLTYNKIVKEGRKEVEYNFTFDGTLQ